MTIYFRPLLLQVTIWSIISLIITSAKSGMTALYNVPKNYTIINLDSNTSNFASQIGKGGGASSYDWTASPIKESSAYSLCRGTYLLGGASILDYARGTQSMISNKIGPLPPHNSIYMKFSLWFIDKWNTDEYVILNLQTGATNTPISGIDNKIIAQFSSQSAWSQNICGDSTLNDLGPVIYLAQISSSETSFISMALTMNDIGSSSRGQIGLRDVELVFSNTSTTSFICAITPALGVLGSKVNIQNCPCPARKFFKPLSCLPCDSTCEFCSGPNPDQCLTCQDGHSYDGSHCILCDKSCKTCFGTSKGECSSCPEGMFLYWNFTCLPKCNSPFTQYSYHGSKYCNYPCDANMYLLQNGDCSSTCNPPHITEVQGDLKFCKISYEDSKTETLALANNIIANISSMSVNIASLLVARSFFGVSCTMLVKMVQYTKFLNITYSDRLLLFFKRSDLNFGFLPFIPKMTASMGRYFHHQVVPTALSQYGVHSSFTINFWQGLLSFSGTLGIFMIVLICEFILQCSLKKVRAHSFIQKVRCAIQNCLGLQFYGWFGDIVLFFILEVKTLKFPLKGECIGFIVGLLGLVIGFGVFVIHARHLYRLYKFRKFSMIENVQTALDEIEDPRKLKLKLREVQSSPVSFQDDPWRSQGYFLLLTFRYIIYNIIIALLFEYPLYQVISFAVMNIVMMGYITFMKPFKDVVTSVQYMAIELISLFVNISLVIVSTIDCTQTDYHSDIENQGQLLIYCSILVGCLAPTSLIVIVVMPFVRFMAKRKKMRQVQNSSPVEIRIHGLQDSQFVGLNPTTDFSQTISFSPTRNHNKEVVTESTPSHLPDQGSSLDHNSILDHSHVEGRRNAIFKSHIDSRLKVPIKRSRGKKSSNVRPTRANKRNPDRLGRKSGKVHPSPSN